jgi:hypothetical protein
MYLCKILLTGFFVSEQIDSEKTSAKKTPQ